MHEADLSEHFSYILHSSTLKLNIFV